MKFFLAEILPSRRRRVFWISVGCRVEFTSLFCSSVVLCTVVYIVLTGMCKLYCKSLFKSILFLVIWRKMIGFRRIVKFYCSFCHCFSGLSCVSEHTCAYIRTWIYTNLRQKLKVIGCMPCPWLPPCLSPKYHLDHMWVCLIGYIQLQELCSNLRIDLQWYVERKKSWLTSSQLFQLPLEPMVNKVETKISHLMWRFTVLYPGEPQVLI